MIIGHVDYIPKYTICMSSVLLHDICTICAIAIYEIGTIVLLIAQDFSKSSVKYCAEMMKYIEFNLNYIIFLKGFVECSFRIQDIACTVNKHINYCKEFLLI